MSTTLAELTEDDVLAISADLGEPGWLRDRRLEAYKAFSDLAWPGPRDEEWRYISPRRFDLTRPILTATGTTEPLTRGVTALVAETAGAARIVDGGTVTATASTDRVVVKDLATAAREDERVVREHLGTAIGADEKFDAANLAAFTAGVFVHIPGDVELAEPVTVTVQAQADGTLIPRVLIVAGPHAKATVYVDHAGAAAATVVEAVEAIAGEGAQLHVLTAQDWGERVDHVATHRGKVYPNGDYRHLEVTLGGRTVYVRPDVALDYPGGNGELLGVYFGSGDQRFEHRSLIHHNASQTTSDLVYKGALQGTSRATFFGNIRIEPHARATASDQTNRNLILTDGAKADSIPFLEIFNSDVVRCGHHSSVGQVDELQLFYMESRGIPREEAARLLVFGFFAEVTDRINLPGVTEAVLAEIEREIQTTPSPAGRR